MYRIFIKTVMDFIQDRRGAVAVMAVCAAVPLILAGAAGVDFSAYLRDRVKLQTALDSAVIAASKKSWDEAGGRENLRKFIKDLVDLSFLNEEEGNRPKVVVTVRPDKSGLDAKAEYKISAHFLPIIGINTFSVNVESGVKFPDGFFDISFVLDNSNSMWSFASSNSRVRKKDELERATLAFLDIIEGTPSFKDTTQVGLVPFGAAVNVGNRYQYQNASWLDLEGLSPIHSENFSKKVNRFDIFKKLDIEWGGCVEVRPQPYDVHDFDPSSSEIAQDGSGTRIHRDARFFVPWFKADEPDKFRRGDPWATSILGMYTRFDNPRSRIYGNYLDDGIPTTAVDRISDPKDFRATARFMERFRNVEKYKKSNLLSFDEFSDSNVGPNDGCNGDILRPITALTNGFSDLKEEVRSLLFGSSLTNILDGVAWGWRVLSPEEPFASGSRGAERRKKIMILLSDGQNTLPTSRDYSNNIVVSPIFSDYSAYGYAYTDRFKTGVTKFRSDDTLDFMSVIEDSRLRLHILNERTIKVCNNAKKAGITLYTIAFGSEALNNKELREVLESCASSLHHAFRVESDLTSIFVNIANEITKLHIDR